MNPKFFVVNWSDNSIQVLKASKVICLNEENVGSDVLMKYKGETWKGIIESIWGNTLLVMFFWRHICHDVSIIWELAII